MPARRGRRKRPVRGRKRQKGGFLPGWGVARGAINLVRKYLVKDKGAKKALTESMGTKLKNAWYGITG